MQGGSWKIDIGVAGISNNFAMYTNYFPDIIIFITTIDYFMLEQSTRRKNTVEVDGVVLMIKLH